MRPPSPRRSGPAPDNEPTRPPWHLAPYARPRPGAEGGVVIVVIRVDIDTELLQDAVARRRQLSAIDALENLDLDLDPQRINYP